MTDDDVQLIFSDIVAGAGGEAAFSKAQLAVARKVALLLSDDAPNASALASLMAMLPVGASTPTGGVQIIALSCSDSALADGGPLCPALQNVWAMVGGLDEKVKAARRALEVRDLRALCVALEAPTSLADGYTRTPPEGAPTASAGRPRGIAHDDEPDRREGRGGLRDGNVLGERDRTRRTRPEEPLPHELPDNCKPFTRGGDGAASDFYAASPIAGIGHGKFDNNGGL